MLKDDTNFVDAELVNDEPIWSVILEPAATPPRLNREVKLTKIPEELDAAEQGVETRVVELIEYEHWVLMLATLAEAVIAGGMPITMDPRVGMEFLLMKDRE